MNGRSPGAIVYPKEESRTVTISQVSDRVPEAAGHDGGALAADMGRLGQIGKVRQETSVLMQAVPTAPAIKIRLTQCLNRASVDTLTALLSRLEQTGFLGFYQRVMPQLGFGHEASQATRAAHGSDQHAVNTKPAQSRQINKVFVGPAGHERGFIEIVRSWCQT